MQIVLRIDNIDRLADGGALEYRTGERGFDIGRQQHLDWTLPDPDRVISGHHCQIRFENGSYWLTDVSRNGTYLNNSQGRMRSPHRLASGDRLQIGPYFISVDISGDTRAAPTPPPVQQAPRPAAPVSGGDIWGTASPGPPPVSREWISQTPAAHIPAPAVLNEFISMPSPRPANPFDSPAGGFSAANPLQNVPPAQFPSANAAPAAAPMAPATAPPPGSLDPFVATMAAAAGMSPAMLASRNQQELAREVGQTLAILSEQLVTLLRFRAAAKRMTKSSLTVVAREGNNPLKFVADPAEALGMMFGPPKPGYLNGPASVTEAMKNLAAHEVATYAAMQKALARLLEDLSPDAIEEELKGGIFASKKAKAWEVFATRWRAKEDRGDNGMLDAFLKYFSQAYDDAHKP